MTERDARTAEDLNDNGAADPAAAGDPAAEVAGTASDARAGAEAEELLRSNDELAPGPEGGMGVSSERVGPTGPGQVGTDGVRYTGPTPTGHDVPPEQSAGGEEPRPDSPGPPVSGYPSSDPRSGDKPFRPSQ